MYSIAIISVTTIVLVLLILGLVALSYLLINISSDKPQVQDPKMFPKNLVLTRPIVFLDVETTGLDVSNDKIVSICVVKCHPAGFSDIYTVLINPEMPIPTEASIVNNITDELVADMPTFPEVAKAIYHYLDGADVAGFNSNVFDIPILTKELSRAGIEWDTRSVVKIDVATIVRKQHPRNLGASYRMYTGDTLEGAHNAEVDVMATIRILDQQIAKARLAKPTVEEVLEYQMQK